MSKKIIGVVTNVATKSYNLDGIGQMNEHKITVQDAEGKKVTVKKSTKKDTPFSLSEGTEVQVTYVETERQNGSGETFLDRKIEKNGLVLLNQAKKDSPLQASTTSKANSSTTSAGTDWAAKDLSMEVSGLLQALITTGSYTNGHSTKSASTEHGITDQGFSQLETDLKRTLILKRNVARLSQEGKLTEEKASKVVAKKVVEVQDDDDDAPFDLEV